MTTLQFMSYLRSQGFKVWAVAGRLRYSAPAGALTPDLDAELAEREAEIVDFLNATARAAQIAKVPLQRVSRDGHLPASFAQQRLWFLDQLELSNSAYNVPTAMRLTGLLNVGALEQSLNEIIRRHEALRTSFGMVEGQPVQVIASAEPLILPVVDIQEVAEAGGEAEAQRPFDLARGPLFRASLLRLGKEDHVLLLTLHHIVSDGWSQGVLFHEISVLYNAFSTGQPSPLSELPVQYADFAVWQRQWLQGEVLANQLSYWKGQLGESLPVLELPTDRPRPAVQTYRGARHSIELPKGLSEGLKELSRREGVSLFMVLLAAFQILLHRYTGQEDIVVGSPIANRNRAEIEGLIGFFVNTLVLRSDLSGDPSFRQLLHRVREVCLGAYAHQDLPFEKLVEELQPERDLSCNPLFQVLFALQNAPRQAPKLRDLTLTPLEFDSGTVRFDLEFHLWELPGGVKGRFVYNRDLFDAPTIARMAGHFQTLLEGIVAEPDRSISTLPLLTGAERHQLLVEWNETRAEYPKEKCIHQLFEARAERSADSIAAAFEDEQLTYRELNRRANQLAHHLRKLGVGPDVLVGVCMERSLEMVVGILGILKAGGAYVPLDPAYPAERLGFMVEDSQAQVLLTQKHLVERFSGQKAKAVCLDADRGTIGQENEENPNSGVTADNLAYVIYTSGSTGKPKGVAMRHRPLCNLISWQLQNSTFNGARTLQFASLSFDVSFQEIFSTWCSGGTLLLISGELRRDAVALLSFLEDRAVERLFLPFVALHHLAEVVEQQSQVPTKLREIITAGEQLQITPQIAGWLSKSKSCSLQNQYGPTESHVVTAFRLTGLPTDWPVLPPIGRPISNSQIYLLDSHLQPVPVGIPGELYIGGECLARGYLNRPELTAERFVLDPFGKEPAGSLYKTGDLARYLPDGNIEFLGRTDHQTKVRGHRVELEEIEAVIRGHPQVSEAVVLAREDSPGGKRLVGYVVNREPAQIGDLRNFLQEKLPDYMVPSAFVFLDSLPLTPSGKVDRRALPAPDESRPELKETFVSPRTPVEKVIAGIWAEVLKLEQVGIHDNFFDLGGHSLLATQVMSRLRHTLQVELPLRALFENPTVADLAVQIAQTQVKSAVPKELAEVLVNLESLSDEEAKHLLAQESPKEI